MRKVTKTAQAALARQAYGRAVKDKHDTVRVVSLETAKLAHAWASEAWTAKTGQTHADFLVALGCNDKKALGYWEAELDEILNLMANPAS